MLAQQAPLVVWPLVLTLSQVQLVVLVRCTPLAILMHAMFQQGARRAQVAVWPLGLTLSEARRRRLRSTSWQTLWTATLLWVMCPGVAMKAHLASECTRRNRRLAALQVPLAVWPQMLTLSQVLRVRFVRCTPLAFLMFAMSLMGARRAQFAGWPLVLTLSEARMRRLTS